MHKFVVVLTSFVNQSKLAYPFRTRPPQLGNRVDNFSSYSSILNTPVALYVLPILMYEAMLEFTLFFKSIKDVKAARCSFVLARIDGSLKGIITTLLSSLYKNKMMYIACHSFDLDFRNLHTYVLLHVYMATYYTLTFEFCLRENYRIK